MLMDTRQLAAFCAVVERRSFSQAAERLGVTQPAVSLQIRALEERLGQRLLDRSGRRVEPTEAGMLLYRNAQKLLALEEQLVEEVSAAAEGALTGRLEIGASTGPGGSVLPPLLCEFQEANPGTTIGLSVFDTQTVIDLVGRRELDLGVGGAARRQGRVVFEPFFRDEVVLAVPPAHPFAGRTVSLEELRSEPLIVMQEGAGVRQVIEDELRATGTRLRDLEPKLELGLQESVRSAVRAGYGVTFISRSAVEAELAAGTIATARVEGLEPAREISLVRAAGRSPTRLAEAFVAFARERLAWSSAGGSTPPRPSFRGGGPRGPPFLRGGGSGAHLAAIVYDVDLVGSPPLEVTVGTAMNALAHCAEALYVKGRNDDADAHALEGARLIGEFLPRVVEAPEDRELREGLLRGACEAGQALGGSMLALGHAIAQALGGRYGLPHGALNAICLPAALRFNKLVAPDALRQLGAALGTDDPIGRVEELARLGGFERLRDLGVPEDQLDEVAAAAAVRAGAKANPRSARPDQIAELLRSVF